MKNRKPILYINIFVVLFAIITVLLKLFNNQYFILFSIAFAILSIVFLIVAILMLFSEKKQKNKIQNIKVEKEEKGKKYSYQKDQYKKLCSNIDFAHTQEDILKAKIEVLAEEINIVGGLFYWIDGTHLYLKNTYALVKEEYKNIIEIGEGLTGQVAKNGQYIKIGNTDKIDFNIISGLGTAKPQFLYILPVFKNKEIIAVIELATFTEITENNINILIEILSSNE